MQVQLLFAEIGSTTTVVTGFDRLNSDTPVLLGQGKAPTSVDRGDVRIGLEAALEDLKQALGAEKLGWGRFAAASSAAGGLRMSVHGLVYDMTVKAAREAALGAGANLCGITAGKMGPGDLDRMTASRPHIILIAGGVDHGEKETALHNAAAIRDALTGAALKVPVLYAGNSAAREEVAALFEGTGLSLHITDNVYPRIDELVVEPARRIIQDLFEVHITAAPGMEHVRDLVDGPILPVPGAVMEAAKLARERYGDLLVFDVGGATTDLHSVCSDSPEAGRMMIAPEPEAKRTVEGDLGVYVNRRQVRERGGKILDRTLGLEGPDTDGAVEALPPIPQTEKEIILARELAFHAGRTALERHAGRYRELYSLSGKQRYAEGKDLTAVQTVIGTGGALTRLGAGEEILRRILESGSGRELYPPKESRILLDRHYILAAAGVISREYPGGAAALIAASLES